MAIRAVLFDLGETLLHYGSLDTNVVLREAAELSYRFLVDRLASAPRRLGFQQYRRRTVWAIKWRYLWSNVTNREFNGLRLLKRVLRRLNLALSPADLLELGWLWYKPLADRATIDPALPEHLERLTGMGLRLAIVSNTFSPPAVLDRQLRNLDLLRFFPVRLYSSMTVFRKPDPRIFTRTLRELAVAPAEAVMVGDRLRQDITGARRAGIRPVLLRPRPHAARRAPPHVTVIEQIAELPELVAWWNRT